MKNNEHPECPKCGSEYLIRIGETLLPSDDCDPEKSGQYRCRHCGTESQYIVRKEADEIPGYSPSAQCPKCKSYETKIVGSPPHRDCRYHLCLDCNKGFKTRRLDRQINRPEALPVRTLLKQIRPKKE